MPIQFDVSMAIFRYVKTQRPRTRRRAPPPIRHLRNQHARPTRTREPKPRPHSREDSNPPSLLYHTHRYLLDHPLFPPGHPIFHDLLPPFHILPITLPVLLLNIKPILTETPQYPCRLLTLFIQSGWPESLRPQFIAQFVDRWA